MQKDFAFGLIPIYQDQDKIEFLLTQHVEGHWAFPKGHKEGDESALQTAQREFEEETGITHYQVADQPTFQEEYYPQKNDKVTHKTVVYFLAWVSNKQVVIQDEEVQDYGWFDYQRALERITFAGSKKILKEVKKYLQKNEISRRRS